MDINEPYFGMTEAEIKKIQKDIMSWRDSNHPVMKTSDKEDSFNAAFTKGAANLKEDIGLK
jgi:GH43 family beta-xylosidase